MLRPRRSSTSNEHLPPVARSPAMSAADIVFLPGDSVVYSSRQIWEWNGLGFFHVGDHWDSKLTSSGILDGSPQTEARDDEICNIRPRKTVNGI
ncbi:hypothetical protein TIFTF001_013425 [Ficus carica]|uniref:Uncharacterized protein n=1 Tax=Ficus carica TaxID=3494 RepID=A0AA88APV8_FICCA|nr:hypothetical protein TIFTF001_013425 [Ficus carica]